MRRVVSLLAVATLLLAGLPPPIAAAAGGQETGRISGTATSEGRVAPRVTVRLRNVQSGQLVGATTTDDAGVFTFTSLPASTYVVEIIGVSGAIIGTSAAISLAVGAMAASGVSVTVAAGAGAAGGIAASSSGGFFTSALGIKVVLAAVTGGIIATVIAVKEDASPSR